MIDNLKQDLQSLTFSGNVAMLPKEQLKDYPTLKKVLIKACGKYKNNSFTFPYPAKIIVQKLIKGETIDFKKEFQFFVTPKDLANYMANQILWYKEEMDILEPSAGHGALIDEILKVKPENVKVNIHAVELSNLNYEILVDKYGSSINIYNCDFLEFNPSMEFDVILANPPFSKNQDIDHIKKMYSLLKENGRLISVTSKSWSFGSQKKQIAFKNWLEEDIASTWFSLDRGTFKSSGTNVEGILLTIDK
jgi:phospholipid N-methyltransferase